MHIWILQYELLKLNEILCANTFELNLCLTVFSCLYICCTKYPIFLTHTPKSNTTHLYLHYEILVWHGLNKCSIYDMNSHTHYMLVKPLNFNFLIHQRRYLCPVFCSFNATSLRWVPVYYVSSILNLPTHLEVI